ncbi:lipase member H-A-like [Planococcus citri]|uniref:lipase member H-A-like n=1 Tax=Planococcus citri TaxID=170843 RepID=UPI0031F8B9BE
MLTAILANRPEIKLEKIHVIGFSMGAQVCARFANSFKPKIIPRVAGLDPAFPKFFPPFLDGDNILHKDHGAFVDVIHTNIGRYGVLYSDAHYDIYANKAVNQPGCNEDTSCNHRRAVVIYTESINGKTKFIARKCKHNKPLITVGYCDGDKPQRLEVGEYCPPPKHKDDEGTYQFDTNDKPPFAKGPI